VDDDSFKSSRTEIAEFFDRYGIALILPFYYENRINGLLCLGLKDNLSGFSPDEVEKIYEYRARTNDFITSALTFDKAKKEQFISRSLNLSSDILEKASADKLPEMKNISFSSLTSPRYSKGVDYFDFLQPTRNSIGILCSDVSGIGINNALYSVILRAAFHGCINEAASPYIIIKRINLVLSEYTGGAGELVTAFYCYYDADSKRIFYTNAGFPPMEVFRIEKNDFDTLDTEGSPLGYDAMSEFGQGRTELKSGDICVIYSKSLINSRNNEGTPFGLLRLRGAIRESRGKHPSEIAFNLKKVYEKFMNKAHPDTDVTVLIMKIN
jgi:sigma-B regulation protein RsbU (phosphoserine phosphatase)